MASAASRITARGSTADQARGHGSPDPSQANTRPKVELRRPGCGGPILSGPCALALFLLETCCDAASASRHAKQVIAVCTCIDEVYRFLFEERLELAVLPEIADKKAWLCHELASRMS